MEPENENDIIRNMKKVVENMDKILLKYSSLDDIYENSKDDEAIVRVISGVKNAETKEAYKEVH